MFKKDQYYEIERDGKTEIVVFKNHSLSVFHFNFVDGDCGSLDLTWDLLESRIYKIKHLKALSTIMA